MASGYPEGLHGEQIPLGARIVALADAYDAIVRGRPYQSPQSHRDAVLRADPLLRQPVRPGAGAAVHRGDRTRGGGRPAPVALPPAALLGRDLAVFSIAGDAA